MNKRFLILAMVVFALIVPAAALKRAGMNPLLTGGGAEALASEVTASGFIEADQISIAAETGGRIRDLPVGEGDKITTGQVIAALDDSVLEQQMGQAQAATGVARANLALVKAGTRPEEIQLRKATLAQAETVRDGARIAWENAKAARDNPQEMNARIASARGQLEVAQQNIAVSAQIRDNAVKDYDASLRAAQTAIKAADLQVNQAQVNADQAEELKIALQPPITTENWIRPPYGVQNSMQYDLNVFQAQLAQNNLALAQTNREMAQTNLDKLVSTRAMVDVTAKQYQAAVTARDSAQAVLDDLLSTRQNPLGLKSQVDAAEAAYQQAGAAVSIAQAALDVTLAGATKEQITVAEAQVTQAESALRLLETQRAKMTINSPVTGMVSQAVAHKGEVVSPGAAIVKAVDLQTVTLKVFIPETQIGQIRTGNAAQVKVDSYPERTFSGRVTFISTQAEFTPKDIQTAEERAKTVFAVKVSLDNPGGTLKPGMPADATIRQ